MEKENKKGNGGLFLTLGLLLLGAGYLFYEARKSYKKIEKQEEEETKAADQLKVNKEDLLKKNNLVEATFTGCTSEGNSLFDEEEISSVFDVDSAIDAENTIHLRETGVKEENGRNYFQIMVEIPTTKESDYTEHKNPKIGDYVRCLGLAAEDIKNIVGMKGKPYQKLEGYYAITYTAGNGENYSKMIKIPEEIYSKYSQNSPKEGLTSYVRLIRDGELPRDGEIEMGDFLKKYVISSKEVMKNVKWRDVYLYFTISIPVGDVMGPGIGIKGAMESIKYLIKDFKVFNRKGGEMKYEHVIFHTTPEWVREDDNTAEGDLTWYYRRKSNGELFKDFFVFED